MTFNALGRYCFIDAFSGSIVKFSQYKNHQSNILIETFKPKPFFEWKFTAGHRCTRDWPFEKPHPLDSWCSPPVELEALRCKGFKDGTSDEHAALSFGAVSEDDFFFLFYCQAFAGNKLPLNDGGPAGPCGALQLQQAPTRSRDTKYTFHCLPLTELLLGAWFEGFEPPAAPSSQPILSFDSKE